MSLAHEFDAAGLDVDQTEQAARQSRLAAARFATIPSCFAAMNVQRNAIDGVNIAMRREQVSPGTAK